MILSIIRHALLTQSIYDIPLRVTFYARVSTNSNDQLNSLANQIAYYTNFIKSKTNWFFIPGYVDEGISGATAKKRDEFQRMVRDAKDGLFDLVMTKEIARFSRNTLDSIKYTRELLSAGVGVIFENDGINTFDEDAELRLTIMSSIAQDELHKLSSRVKFGHKQAIKNGVVLGNSRIFGYVKDNGRLVIDEEEAEMVRLLFEMYATGKYSMKQIEDIFLARGYRNHNGHKITHTTMSSIINNPKYKGYYVGNKVEVVDLFTKKQKFLPPEEWIIFKDNTGEIVPAIVSEGLWEQANEVLRRRSQDVKQRKNICTHRNLLTGKLFCAHCEAPYYRRESIRRNGEKNGKWICSSKLNNGTKVCPSFSILERDVLPILIAVLSGQALPDFTPNINDSQENNRIEAEISLIKKKQQKLLSHRSNNKIQDEDFDHMNAQLAKELDILIRKCNTLASVKHSITETSRILDEMHTAFSTIDPKDTISLQALVAKYISRITATPNEDSQFITLDVCIVTGDIFRYTIKRAKKRTQKHLPK